MLKFYSALSVLIFLFSCSEDKKLSAEESSRAVEEINQMFDAYHAAIEKDGLLGELDYLDTSTDFFWVPPGYNSALSYDSVKNILRANSKALLLAKFQWDTLQIFPLSPLIASYSGVVTGTMMDTAEVKTSVRIIESGTVIKRSDGWKILSGQSAILPTTQ